MEKDIYTTQTMYEIGGGDKHMCSFDFSLIPDDEYTKLFNAFPNFIYKKVERISFNCNFQYKYSQLGHKSVRREKIITASIANRRPKLIPYLAKILKFVIPKSKTLKSIEISSMHIPRGMEAIILRAIAKSKSLETVVFNNVKIPDHHVIRFLGEITPYQYTEVSFISCGLSNECYSAFKSFIRQRSHTAIIDRRLQTLRVDGNDFSDHQIESLRNLVDKGREEDLTDGDGEPDITIDDFTMTSDDTPPPSPRNKLIKSPLSVTNKAAGSRIKPPELEHQAKSFIVNDNKNALSPRLSKQAQSFLLNDRGSMKQVPQTSKTPNILFKRDTQKSGDLTPTSKKQSQSFADKDSNIIPLFTKKTPSYVSKQDNESSSKYLSSQNSVKEQISIKSLQKRDHSPQILQQQENHKSTNSTSISYSYEEEESYEESYSESYSSYTNKSEHEEEGKEQKEEQPQQMENNVSNQITAPIINAPDPLKSSTISEDNEEESYYNEEESGYEYSYSTD